MYQSIIDKKNVVQCTNICCYEQMLINNNTRGRILHYNTNEKPFVKRVICILQ